MGKGRRMKPQGFGERGRKGEPYSDFKINHLLGKSTHIIIEAEAVFACLLRCKHKISLAFFLGVHNDLVTGAHDAVVDVEGTARLDLKS